MKSAEVTEEANLPYCKLSFCLCAKTNLSLIHSYGLEEIPISNKVEILNHALNRLPTSFGSVLV